MCYICSCFAWSLDLVQRIITFGLACVLCCAVCFGLSIAIIAGIAYGYNYSMAEFITFTRSDVTVFMRRGQFADRPELRSRFRRTGEEEDLFTANSTTDYEDHRPPAESKPLADTWLKTQDTRKYAEILTRYNPNKKLVDNEPTDTQNVVEESPVPVQVQAQPIPQPPVRYIADTDSPVISIMPNPLIPTVSWRSGSSEIMMRNFQPMNEFTSAAKHTSMPENLIPTRTGGPHSVFLLNPKEQAKAADTKQRDDFHQSYMQPLRVWGSTTRPLLPDDPEDVDEENIVYKPV